MRRMTNTMKYANMARIILGFVWTAVLCGGCGDGALTEAMATVDGIVSATTEDEPSASDEGATSPDDDDKAAATDEDTPLIADQNDSEPDPGVAIDAPSPRGGAPAVWIPHQRRMLLFGGMSPITGDTLAYDYDGDTWWDLSLQDRAPMPAPRCHHILVASGAGPNAYMFGGFSFAGRFNDVWRFNADEAQWSELQPTGDVPAVRCLHTAAYIVSHHEILIYGGVQGGGGAAGDYFSDTHLLDLERNVWSNIDVTGPGKLRGAICVYAPGEDGVYLWGGKQVTTYPSTLWRFDVADHTWSQVATTGDTPPGREDPAFFWDDVRGRLRIFFGRNDTLAEPLLEDAYEFNVTDATWEALDTAGAPPPRWRPTVVTVVADGVSVLFGGWTGFGGGAALADTWRYKWASNEWTQVAAFGP